MRAKRTPEGHEAQENRTLCLQILNCFVRSEVRYALHIPSGLYIEGVCQMSIIDLCCPHCGGQIVLDDANKFGFCMYCGHKIMLSDVTTHVVKVDNSERLASFLKLVTPTIESGNAFEMRSLSNDILQMDPEQGSAWLCRGHAAALEGNFKECFQSWAKAVRLGGMTDFERDFDQMADSVKDGIIIACDEDLAFIRVARSSDVETVLYSKFPEQMAGTSLIANVTSRCEAALSTYRSWAQEQISTACTNLTSSSLAVIKDPKALHELAANALGIIRSSQSGFGFLNRLSGSNFELNDQLQEVMDITRRPDSCSESDIEKINKRWSTKGKFSSV